MFDKGSCQGRKGPRGVCLIRNYCLPNLGSKEKLVIAGAGLSKCFPVCQVLRCCVYSTCNKYVINLERDGDKFPRAFSFSMTTLKITIAKNCS